MDELTGYLALVFHRFTHPYPDDDIRQIVIDINGYPIPQRDPFLRDNPAVQTTGVQRIGNLGATLRGYTLPYQNRLRDEDKKLLDLSEQRGKTLTDTQGFYVYRAYRLITWGSWFRMLPKKQATKLSRVQVDIPNSLDAEWTLDIKKSRATPPKIISDVMKRYVDRLAKPSRRAQQFRGRRKNDAPLAPVWDVVDDRDGAFRYEINRNNPYIASFLDSLSPEQQGAFINIVNVLSIIGIALTTSSFLQQILSVSEWSKKTYQEYSARDDYRSHVSDCLQRPRTTSFRRPPQATTATTLMGQVLAT